MEKNNIDSQKIEKRSFKVIDLRMAENKDGGEKKSRTVEGYAATYDNWAEFYWFREKISPGAFTNSLIDSDARALFNHDPNQLLARQKSGTLELWEDEKGLGFRFELPESRDDILEMIERGDLDEMSFAFTVKRSAWVWNDDSDEKDEKHIEEVGKLYDIAPVTYPAYTNTELSLRSKESYDEAKAARTIDTSQIEIENANRARNLRLSELQS